MSDKRVHPIVPLQLEYASLRPGRGTDRLVRAFAFVAIIALLSSGSVAWALLVRHR